MDAEKKCPFEVGQTVKLTEEGLKAEGDPSLGEPFVVTKTLESVRTGLWLVYGHEHGPLYSDHLELVALEPADYAGAAERKLEDWPEAAAYREEIDQAHEELIKAFRFQTKAAIHEAKAWEVSPNTQDALDASAAVCEAGFSAAKAATLLIHVAMVAGEESQRWLLGGDVK